MIRPILAVHLQETVEALADGKTANEMAASMYVSTNTVRTRLRTLFQLLGARDQAHAVAIGFRTGVLIGHQLELPCVLADGVPLDLLIAARTARGITQSEMAEMLEVSLPWLGTRERGQQPFPMLVLKRYASVVGVELHVQSVNQLTPPREWIGRAPPNTGPRPVHNGDQRSRVWTG